MSGLDLDVADQPGSGQFILWLAPIGGLGQRDPMYLGKCLDYAEELADHPPPHRLVQRAGGRSREQPAIGHSVPVRSQPIQHPSCLARDPPWPIRLLIPSETPSFHLVRAGPAGLPRAKEERLSGGNRSPKSTARLCITGPIRETAMAICFELVVNFGDNLDAARAGHTLPNDGPRLSRAGQADRAGYAGTEVRAVAVRVLALRQVLLVVFLREVELARRHDLGGDRTEPGLGQLLPVSRRRVLRGQVVVAHPVGVEEIG